MTVDSVNPPPPYNENSVPVCHITSVDVCAGFLMANDVCAGFLIANKVIVRLFPSPYAVEATLRFLADKVASVFTSLIPYATSFWTVASIGDLGIFFLLMHDIIAHRHLPIAAQKHFPNEIIRTIATVANAILFVGGTSTALLADTCVTLGQLHSWKNVLSDLRRVSFLSSFFIAMNNFHTVPFAVARQLLNIGVVLLSPCYGYTTAIGAMAAISCLLGPVQFFESESARPFGEELAWS
jgi:hypothetical protein